MFFLAYLFVSYVENTVLKNSKILSSGSRFAIFWLPFTKGLSKLIPLVPKGPTEQGQQPAVTQSESSCRLPVTSSGDVTSEVNHVPKIDILEWSIKMTGQENFELFYHQLFCYRGVVSPSTTCSSSCYCMKPLSQALHYHLMPLRMMFGFTPPYPQVVPGLDTSGNKADWSRQPADHCCAVCTTAEASALLVPWLCVLQCLTACWGPARVPAVPELLIHNKLLCLLED